VGHDFFEMVVAICRFGCHCLFNSFKHECADEFLSILTCQLLDRMVKPGNISYFLQGLPLIKGRIKIELQDN